MQPFRPALPAFSLALLAAFSIAVPAHAQGMMMAPPPPLRPGTAAPGFRTTTLQGKPLSLASLRGKVVLLDYWATWCGPCRMATPTLQSLQKRFGNRGFTVVGMSMDQADTMAQVKPFVKAMHLSYPITVSQSGNARAQLAYRANALPSQYLIDKKGIVRWSQAGYSVNEGQELSVLIRKLLAEH